MSAVASTIFKIRAHSDFHSKDSHPMLLSFRKGQPFYALSSDYEKGYYFVSTQFAVPFSRKAVTGMVPMDKFEKVDLFSKEVAVKKQVAKKPIKESEPMMAPQMMENQKKKRNAPLTAVTSAQVLSITESSEGFAYCFKVTRGLESYYLVRSIREVETFKQYITANIPSMQQPNIKFKSQQELIKAQDEFFNTLLQKSGQVQQTVAQALQTFFQPNTASEMNLYKRRDSGFSRNEKDEKDTKDNKKPIASLGAKISMFIFGH